MKDRAQGTAPVSSRLVHYQQVSPLQYVTGENYKEALVQMQSYSVWVTMIQRSSFHEQCCLGHQ